jgi:tyrosinase
VPELVGASAAPFTISGGSTEINLEVRAPTGPAAQGDVEGLANWLPRRVFLNIENITSNERSAPYEVYLNVPPGERPEEHPELHAGSLALFGLVAASRADDRDSGHGLYEQLEITTLYPALAVMSDWDPEQLRISFVPSRPGSPMLQVGRVTLYFA